tara:strand:- start:2380 stop:2511 length:132 start_codon:yes stop_codon:yes gene_type:complete
MQTYKLKNLPFFTEAKLILENKKNQTKDTNQKWFKGSKDRGLK